MNLLPLQDLWVVITRPADQSAGLIKTIEEMGGHAIPWPALMIKPIDISNQTRQSLSALKTYDHIIFISVNAVNFGLAAMVDQGIDLDGMDVFAVGKTTAKSLENAGIQNVHVPEIASSEGLLAMLVFSAESIKGKRCLIVRGKGGNEKLAKELLMRGASAVNYAEVYQRSSADSDPVILEQHWQNNQLDLIIITSIAGLDNLFAILGKKNQSRLCSTPLLTVSDRVAEHAKRKGFTHPILVAKSAIDKDIIATMRSWHQVRGKNNE